MTITTETIITAASLVTAIGVIIGVIYSVFRWLERRRADGTEIAQMKKENALICYALSACLDGLTQLGANHTVPIAKAKLDEYLNQAAHK